MREVLWVLEYLDWMLMADILVVAGILTFLHEDLVPHGGLTVSDEAIAQYRSDVADAIRKLQEIRGDHGD